MRLHVILTHVNTATDQKVHVNVLTASNMFIIESWERESEALTEVGRYVTDAHMHGVRSEQQGFY